MGAGRWELQRGEPALVERMQRMADGLLGATQVVGNRGGHLALGTGEQDLTAAYSQGGRRPVSRVARSSARSGRT